MSQAVEIARRLGDGTSLAPALAQLGCTELALGELAAAEVTLAEGLVTAQRLTYREFALVAMYLLGDVARRRGDLDLVRSRYRESLRAAERLGLAAAAATALTRAAGLNVDEDRHAEAVCLPRSTSGARRTAAIRCSTRIPGRKSWISRERAGRCPNRRSWKRGSSDKPWPWTMRSRTP
jgi:hypothetical protein